MSLVSRALEYDTYGLGDIVLFGIGERTKIDDHEDTLGIFLDSRMKIDDHEDIMDVLLDYRVYALSRCLSPLSGWKHNVQSMLCLLEDPEEMYHLYLEQEKKKNEDDDKGEEEEEESSFENQTVNSNEDEEEDIGQDLNDGDKKKEEEEEPSKREEKLKFDSKREGKENSTQKQDYERRLLQGSMYGTYSFINVSQGKEEYEKQSMKNMKNMINMVEVAVVSEIVASLFKECVAAKQKLKVGCLSPYQGQVLALRNKLGETYNTDSYPDFTVDVQSVDEFKGGVEDLIIISTALPLDTGQWCYFDYQRLCLEGTCRDAKARGCFYDANDDKDLAQAVAGALVELNELDALRITDSQRNHNTRWKQQNPFQMRYSEPDNRDWRGRSAPFPTSGEERSWETIREKRELGCQFNHQDQRNSQFPRAQISSKQGGLV
ncbi:hypothetical protein C3L33_01798, partial [Rhododendron williamsianum]